MFNVFLHVYVNELYYSVGKLVLCFLNVYAKLTLFLLYVLLQTSHKSSVFF